MSTVEKLFVQIFERKNQIIEQVKHQTDAFDHHLASKLIVEGFNPPPWLLNPSFEISSSDPKELKKEELISELLLPRSQPTMVPYYNGLYSLHNKSAITENTGEFSDGLPVETHASSKGLDAGEWQTAVPQCNNDETEIPVSGVLEPGPSATSSPNQIDARISNIYSEADQSLARIQRSKSRQKALELRNSSKERGKICLEDENNNGKYSSDVGVSRNAFQQSNLVNELLELVKPSDTSNEKNGEKEAEIGDRCNMENGANIYSGRVTRSRSSSQRTKCVDMDASSHIAYGESVKLSPSVGKPVQQSAYASALLDPSNITDKSHASMEDKMGVRISKEKGSYGYSGRITRSRSCSEKACSLEDSPKVGNSSNIARVDIGTQAESIPNLRQWPNNDNNFLELVKPFENKGQCCEVKEATKVDIWSKEKGSVVYCGRITRSRSSYQRPNCLDGFSELDNSSNIINEDGRKFTQPISKLEESSEPSRSMGGDAVSQNTLGKQISVRNSSPRQKYLELPAEDATEHPDKGNIADKHVGRRTRSTSFASGCSSIWNTLNRPEGFDPLKSSGSGAKILPCAETNNIAKQERRASTVAETDVVSDKPADSHLVCSGSNLDVTSVRVGSEVLVAKPPSGLDMFVKPKQLDFDNVEDSSLNEASVPAPIKKRQDTSSSGKRCFTSLVPAESLERVTSSNRHENSVPPLKKLLLGELEVLSKEEEAWSREEEARSGSTGSDAEERVEIEQQKIGYGPCPAFSASRTSNKSAVSSTKKTMEEHEMRSPHTSPEGIKISLLDHSVASKAFRKSSCEGLLENPVDSNLTIVDSDIRLTLSFVKGVGEVDVSLQDPAVKYPAVSVNESESCVVSQKMNLGSIQFQNAEKVTPSGDSSSIDKIVGDPKSIELQVTEKSAQSGRSFSFTMEGLPQAKRRKIEGQLIEALSASSNSETEPFQGAPLNDVPGNSETVLISPHLHISCEEGVELANASKSPDGGMDQKTDCYVEEGIKSSPKLQVIEAEHGLEGRDKNVNSAVTFETKQLRPPLVSSLTKQASGDFQGFLVEEAEGEGGTDIIHDLRSQCATEKHQGSLHLDGKLGPHIAENLTCMAERAMWKNKPQQEGSGLFSHCSIGSPHNQYLDVFGADQTKPVFEGFVMQEGNEQPQIAGDGISIDKLDLPTTTIERASVLEQLCLSASLHTPLPHFSITDKYPGAPNVYQSVPNGLLEGMDLRSTLSLNDDASKLHNDDIGKLHRASYSCLNEEASQAFQGSSSSDYRPFSSTRFAWSISKPWLSPVGKLWGGSTSSSGSSEKRLSLNPELTCFPIEEDPSMSEEAEQKDDDNDASHEGISSTTITCSAIREPLDDITEQYLDPLPSVSAGEKFSDRGSLDSVNADINVPGTWDKGKEKLQNPYEINTRGTNKTRENQNLSLAEKGVMRATESLQNRFSKSKLPGKTSLRKAGPSLSERESKRNNIVSNITSFVPLVQRTQGAAVVTGKRDVKVKALEAAEAAKRLEEKKENERKMKKEALKLERARLEQENLRQLELKKKKKEEERKKKEAEMAARKRLREEEEKKEKEAKRKRTEEARRQQREHEQKLRAEKEEKEKRHRATVEKVHEKKEARYEIQINKKVEEDNSVQKPETELRATRVSTSDISKASVVLKDSEALSNCGEVQKVTGNLGKASEDNNLVADTSKEQSYDMSPYQSSDDEDEEEDDIPTKKFIPSWASKNYLVIAVSSQQKVDPSMIFPPKSFCSINEALVSRKQQQK